MRLATLIVGFLLSSIGAQGHSVQPQTNNTISIVAPGLGGFHTRALRYHENHGGPIKGAMVAFNCSDAQNPGSWKGLKRYTGLDKLSALKKSNFGQERDIAELDTVVQDAKKNGAQEFIIRGYSRGGATATNYAATPQFKALPKACIISESSYTDADIAIRYRAQLDPKKCGVCIRERNKKQDGRCEQIALYRGNRPLKVKVSLKNYDTDGIQPIKSIDHIDPTTPILLERVMGDNVVPDYEPLRMYVELKRRGFNNVYLLTLPADAGKHTHTAWGTYAQRIKEVEHAFLKKAGMSDNAYDHSCAGRGMKILLEECQPPITEDLLRYLRTVDQEREQAIDKEQALLKMWGYEHYDVFRASRGIKSL